MPSSIRLIFRLAILLFLGLNASCSVFSGGEVLPISDAERLAVTTNIDKLSWQHPYIQVNALEPHVRVYKVAFDGTLNDRERVPSEEQPTIVARIAKLIEDNRDVHYYPGPGMQGESISLIDAMFGTSCIKVAEQAAAEYEKRAQEWRDADPNVEIRIFVTGFSRGAATARHFMNLVSAKDIRVRSASAANSIPPRFYALLFDTVSTGQTDRLLLSLPATLDYLVHFVALDESRPLFTPVIDVTAAHRGAKPILGLRGGFPPDRINLVQMPGAHSDIGSSYPDGIGNEYVVLAEQILYYMGLHGRNCWEIDDYFVGGKHDSRGIFDKLIGVPAPNSSGNSIRRYVPIPVAEQTPAQFLNMIERLDILKQGRPAPFAGTHVSRRKKQGLTLILKRTSNRLQVEGFDDDTNTIDAGSFQYSDNLGVRKLNFRRVVPGGPRGETTLVFDDTLFSYFPEGKVAKLNITRLEKNDRSYLATFVDNKLIRVTPSRSTEEWTTRSRPKGCAVAPNGQAINPINVLIFEPDTN